MRYDKAATVADKLKFVAVILLIALLITGILLKDKADIEYFLYPVYDDKEVIDGVFDEENPFVIMYPNSEEDKAEAAIAALTADEAVNSVTAYANTLGVKLTADEAVTLLTTQFPELTDKIPPTLNIDLKEIVAELFRAYLGKNELDGTERVELYSFVVYVCGEMLEDDNVNNIVKLAITGNPEIKAQCDAASAALNAAKEQLVGDNYSRIMVVTALPKESDEAFAFVERLDEKMSGCFGEYYVLGDSYLAYEMRASYSDELDLITLITVVLIFVVVLMTFRSVIIPVVLVALIQCAVYLTLSFAYIADLSFYYLAIIIVQAILMGATIDYAILYTNNYRESRKLRGRAESLAEAYRNSIHTMLTSSSILFFVTLIIGLTATDPSMSQVCLAIAIGSFFAVTLCVAILPGILAALDKPIMFGAEKTDKLCADIKAAWANRRNK